MGATISYRAGFEPKERRMTPADFELKLEVRAFGKRNEARPAQVMPADGEGAFTTFNTARLWSHEDEASLPELRRKQREIDPIHGKIPTGKTNPSEVGRRDIAAESVFSPTMLQAWITRGILRKVGHFERGEFVPDSEFLEELHRFIWHPETEMFWEHGNVTIVR